MIASAIYWLKYVLVLEYLLFIALTNVTNISPLNIFQCCLVACSACFAWAEVSAHWLCHLRTIVLLVEKVLGWLLDSPRSSCRVNCCWCPGCPRTFGAFQVIFWDFTGLQNAPQVRDQMVDAMLLTILESDLNQTWHHTRAYYNSKFLSYPAEWFLWENRIWWGWAGQPSAKYAARWMQEGGRKGRIDLPHSIPLFFFCMTPNGEKSQHRIILTHYTGRVKSFWKS